MRGLLATSTVTACAAVLTLPFLAASGHALPTAPTTAAGPVELPGATWSLPLVPLRAGGGRAAAAGPVEQGVAPQRVKPFSLVGIVWDNAAAELRGRAQVRTRAVGSHTWSGWQDVEIHDQDRPDPGSLEARRLKGATAPLWVGASDAVEARVIPEGTGRRGAATALPPGMRLELVDPGTGPVRKGGHRSVPGPDGPEDEASSAANAALAPADATEIAATGRPPSADEAAALTAVGDGDPAHGQEAGGPADNPGPQDEPQQPDQSRPQDEPRQPDRPGPQDEPRPQIPADEDDSATAATDDGQDDPGDDSDDSDYSGYAAPRPRIVTRAGWGADESIREKGFVYGKSVKVAFVHHTASGNTYSCSQAPSVIRGIYRYHVVSSGWRDIGYNFLVDKCGTIYEGRAGGVAKPVRGAHTLGFNTDSMGIAVLGTFSKNKPAAAAVEAIARLTAWKLGLYGGNPAGRATLTSAGGNLYKKGKKAKLKVISGHRDGYSTECPGDQLYKKLGSVRSTAARLQGR
ncbi:N-acetylmuramoyl-L-alanine amidase [Streptomyces orinoci]|uniref:N-acetylmuramoyl-L-alanine amidase n=1 Tax=Streptomyces orinoci TaxID=67339 RepID=A0ABV3K372_STRON|nr:N-acetylmuramoyl-L-alanine amidase [Streptomyces orinoci]